VHLNNGFADGQSQPESFTLCPNLLKRVKNLLECSGSIPTPVSLISIVHHAPSGARVVEFVVALPREREGEFSRTLALFSHTGLRVRQQTALGELEPRGSYGLKRPVAALPSGFHHGPKNRSLRSVPHPVAGDDYCREWDMLSESCGSLNENHERRSNSDC
jgi:hypothetical protein